MEEHMTFGTIVTANRSLREMRSQKSLYFGPLASTSRDESRAAAFLALPVIETFVVSVLVCVASWLLSSTFSKRRWSSRALYVSTFPGKQP
mmetsp:Transcript_27037/g.48872  ORF Transcript_27037/g.48872 Transcript_27037/m.48872 type:complete len:91 (+) Transcript_27037:509-781(+)